MRPVVEAKQRLITEASRIDTFAALPVSLGDHCPPEVCIPGDVKAFMEYGFDALKVDGCSAQHNVSGWAQQIYAAGNHNMTLEDCGNGPRPSKPIAQGGCPDYHQYRTSGDINNAYSSWVSNAQVCPPVIDSCFA